jgi:RNA polymerase sigma factor (TIGR02999 family)
MQLEPKICQGDSPAKAHELLPLVYEDLRRLAAHKLASMPPNQTLQPTALVHEAWLRLVTSKERTWENRIHFFATAAEVMRHVLIDHLRGKARIKRGGGQQKLDIDTFELSNAPPDEKILLIDEALEDFRKEQPEKAQVVILKFFGGLTDSEVAEAMGISERTVERYWAYAKAWLISHIRDQI